MRLKYIFFLTAVVSFAFTSCKKTPDPTPPPTGTPTRAELTKDSIFLYAKQIYLWSDALPTYDAFKPRGFTTKTTDLLNYEDELLALANSAINPLTGKGYEYFDNGNDTKYSYIFNTDDKNPTAYIPNKKSSVDLEGNGNDFGIKLYGYGQNDDPYNQVPNYYAFFVQAVYPSSPAASAGMRRSDRIYKVNDRALGQVGAMESERTFINSAINGSSIKIEGVKYENGVAGSPYTITLSKASYKSSPVYASKVFTVGAKKIGYFAYARFSSLSNSKPAIDSAFAKFAAANVTELIIDLRYNGGGYVSTAEYLINQIAPTSLTGKVMYSENYNALMQSGGAAILTNQPLLDASGKVQFQNGKMVSYADINYSVAANTEVFLKKDAPLTGVTKVVFIVSGNTASASELIINSLKPYITVKMVGTQTYGKPVGFFPIRIENKYDVYYSLFQTKNSLGEGNYFAGFTPDVPFTDVNGKLDPRKSLDDPRNNFGDPEEYYTSVALREFGAIGPITTSVNKTMSINGKNVSVQSLKSMKPIVDGNEFIGMIETNHKLKK